MASRAAKAWHQAWRVLIRRDGGGAYQRASGGSKAQRHRSGNGISVAWRVADKAWRHRGEAEKSISSP